MDNFIVSARKYRPSTFREVIGQESITRTLKNAIRSEHLAQAFLFTGPRGVGKTTCARILAKTINCLKLTEETEPCNECESCTSFNSSTSFNIHELDAASNNSVDDIRSLVDQVRIPPQAGRYKVYIIDEVHMLSSAAFNAFLKTLEEPPAYAKFILATTEKHKIIPTILSRCQVYDFHRIRVEDIRSHLEWVASTEQVEAETEALHVIALKADGALRDALSIFDQINAFSGGNITYKATIENLNVLDHEYYFRCTDLLLASDIPGLLRLVEEVVSRGFDGHHFMSGLGEHLRNLLMCRDPQTISLLEVSEVVKESYGKQAAVCDTPFLIQALQVQNQCDIDYKNSSNKRLLIELSLLRMTKQDHDQSESPNTAAAPAIKKKTEPIAPAPEKVMPPKADSSGSATAENQKAVAHPVQSSLPAPERTKKSTEKSRRSTLTPSIREALASPMAGSAEEKPESTDVADKGKPETNFSTEAFMEIWSQWIDDISTDQPNLAKSLRKENPDVGVDAVIRVRLENTVLEENLRSLRADIQETLRAGLNNQFILIETEVIETEANERKPYTSKEKYDALLATNPILRDFREEFDLDID